MEQTEAIANSLSAVGVRTRIRMLERAAHFTQLREKKLRPRVMFAPLFGLIQTFLFSAPYEEMRLT